MSPLFNIKFMWRVRHYLTMAVQCSRPYRSVRSSPHIHYNKVTTRFPPPLLTTVLPGRPEDADGCTSSSLHPLGGRGRCDSPPAAGAAEAGPEECTTAPPLPSLHDHQLRHNTAVMQRSRETRMRTNDMATGIDKVIAVSTINGEPMVDKNPQWNRLFDLNND